MTTEATEATPRRADGVRALVEATRARREALAGLLADVETGRRTCLRLTDNTGAKLVVSRSLSRDADLRLTRFEGAVPVGHVEYLATDDGRAQVLRNLAGAMSGDLAAANP